jgi:choline transporter-like protein 2/4/5
VFFLPEHRHTQSQIASVDCTVLLACSFAVKGSNYCVSATRAVQLIVANAMRLATVNVVGDALLFLGKLGVAATCGVVAFAMSNLAYYNDPANFPSTFLSSAILPIALAVLTGFIVAQVRHVKEVQA